MKSKFSSYKQHLSCSDDLVTTYEQTRAGFVALALERNVRATPHIVQARILKMEASKANKPAELLDMVRIQNGLLTAAGISDKALNHLNDKDKNEAINNLIENFLAPAGSNFVEELVFRFLLTRGDTLGGSMRNIGGSLAQYKLTQSIIASLRLADRKYSWLHNENHEWVKMGEDDTRIAEQVKGLTWKNNQQDRLLMYNLKVPIIGNNVDLCLLNTTMGGSLKNALDDEKKYIALGELKGGIDPAGADEHWKTASKSLERIRKGFGKMNQNPHIFFIGAAIENKMANEIWEELQKGILSNAANLNDNVQIDSICGWLINL